MEHGKSNPIDLVFEQKKHLSLQANPSKWDKTISINSNSRDELSKKNDQVFRKDKPQCSTSNNLNLKEEASRRKCDKRKLGNPNAGTFLHLASEDDLGDLESGDTPKSVNHVVRVHGII